MVLENKAIYGLQRAKLLGGMILAWAYPFSGRYLVHVPKLRVSWAPLEVDGHNI